MSRPIVIGGGAIGLSVAYHLAKRGCEDVLLLERHQLTSGTSWHAAGIVGPLRTTPFMTRLAMYALELFPELESASGLSTGYKRTGGFWLARQPERMNELQRIAALGNHFGLSADVLSADVAVKALPYLDLAQHAGALRVAEDAHVNPVDLCMAYAHAAKSLGVEIRERSEVLEIVTNGDRIQGVKLNDDSMIDATQVALCCGAWSKSLAKQAGLPLPLQAVEHMYVVTESVTDIPDPFPVIRDLDTGIYIKGDVGGKLIIGGFEADAKCWNAFTAEGNRPFLELAEDWDQFEPFLKAAVNLIPKLDNVGITHFMNGPESFTMDTKPLVGQAPDVDGLYVAAGMNSVGVMSSAGIGKLVADCIVDGIAPVDMWEIDIARADPKAADEVHLRARMKEAVADLFTMHWPFKQPSSGRALRTSCLHDSWQAQGAVFGVTGTWERGLWYASNASERNLPYSIGQQHWQPIAEREASIMSDGVVVLDLTPFSKFDIEGPDALAFVQQLACAQLDVDIGQCVYTQILNTNGGIDADVTLTRRGLNYFRLTSGASSRWKDHALLRRQSREFSVAVNDVTEDEAVIGVMGQESRNLLSGVSSDDWGRFPFATSRAATIAGITMTATRISFVGELGWELNIRNADASNIFNTLIRAGAKPMGHYALDSCRIEKGYRHWGHDLGSELTPLQTGFAFSIDWDKEFTGKTALIKQKALGITSRMCLFELQGSPLVLHDEPILDSGKVVGLTTSGTTGVRTGLSLALGLVDINAGENLDDTCQRKFEIEIAGVTYGAKALKDAPFDPSGQRMRA